MTVLLQIKGLTKRFQGLVANKDVDFTLGEGEVRSVIGPNGAGKTTFISMISGHLRPTSGAIVYKGQDITRQSLPVRASHGIIRKFQTPSVFNGLSVYQNIELSVIASRAASRNTAARVGEVMELVRLSDHARTLASTLSHGQRQWLEIGMLLGAQAQLLLLDEPTAGMTAEETHATGVLINDLTRELNLSAIIIEHDINFIKSLKAPITVLHLGKVFREGTYERISADPEVRSIYLGTE
jgi:branched-chain amino acid transport system ATP-binding protein